MLTLAGNRSSQVSYDVLAPYSRSAGPMVFEVAQEYGRAIEAKRTEFVTVGPGAMDSLKPMWREDQFVHGLIVNQWPTAEKQREFIRQLADEAKPAVYCVGERRLAVVVHRTNPLQSIRMSALHMLLARPFTAKEVTPKVRKAANWPPLSPTLPTWRDLGWRNVPVRPIAEGPDSWSREILKYRCLRYTGSVGSSRHWGNRRFREDLIECLNGDEVLERVRRDSSAIGFVQYTGQPLEGVKLLAVEDDFPADGPVDFAAFGPVPPIGVDGRVDFFAPPDQFTEQPEGPVELKLGTTLQPDYPLSEPLLLFIHADAKDSVKAFAEFCVSEAGARTAARHGLITPRAQFQAESEARLAEMEQGRGDRIEAIGAADGVGLMNALAVEYTRLESVVQMRYAATSGQSAIEGMLRGRDLMLLCGRVEAHDVNAAIRAQWSALASPLDGSAGVVEHHIASRAVAVVTHSLNKLDSLTTDQLRAIFSGEVRDWRVLAAVDPDVVGSEIRCYGPEAEDPIFKLFFDKLEWRGSTRVDRKTSSQDVLSALSIDPQGIAFVNLADLPDDPAKMGIKVLAIRKGRETVHPASQTVLRGDYPLAEHFFLYIHPHRGDAAGDYADFILTSDSATDIFRQNGFLHALDRDVSD